jgi:predicted nucleic acid-binding protein
MRALVDTNIFLDVLLARQDLADESQQVLDWFDANPGDGWIAWHTLANLYYVGVKTVGRPAALAAIDEILGVFEVSPVGSSEARRARNLGMTDLEDALQATAATAARVDCIVTRNTKDFRRSPIKAMSPRTFLTAVAQRNR